MKVEYETIVDGGLLLQIDCPDLAMGRHIRFRDDDLDTFKRAAQRQVEALNYATANFYAGILLGISFLIMVMVYLIKKKL